MEAQKTLATVVGVVFTIVGIWGFFSGGAILGLTVNTLHNIVHLVTGLLGLHFGLIAADKAKAFNKTFGVIYLLVGILGWIPAVGALLAANVADHIFHLVVGVVIAAVGFFVE